MIHRQLFNVSNDKHTLSSPPYPSYPPQESPDYRDKWITYSCKDAIATWLLHDRLVKELMAQDWEVVREKKTLKFGTM